MDNNNGFRKALDNHIAKQQTKYEYKASKYIGAQWYRKDYITRRFYSLKSNGVF